MAEPQEIVDYVHVTQAALKRAEAEIASLQQSHKQASEAAAAEIPAVVRTLIASGLLRESRKEACVAALADHRGALSVLKMLGERAVPRKQAEAPEPIGVPAADPTKTASAGGGDAGGSSAADQFTRRILALRTR